MHVDRTPNTTPTFTCLPLPHPTLQIIQPRPRQHTKMAEYIQQLQPTSVPESEKPHPTSSQMVLSTNPRTSIQREGTGSGHDTNGPSNCRSTSTSVHGQAQQEENSEFLSETTPLLPRLRRWTSDKLKIRKLLVILSMIIFIVIMISIALSLGIFGTIKLISHSLSKLSPTSVEVLNPSPGTDSLVELLTVNGWTTKDYLMSVKDENSDDLKVHVLNVYEMKERKTKWSNATYETPLTSQPLLPYYALAGSEVVFKIISVEYEENGERETSEKLSVTLQLLNENEVLFCNRTFDVEVNESLNIIKTCRISQTGYYKVSYIGNGTTAYTNITYNTLVFDVNGLKPSCRFNHYSDCSQYVSFGEKPILVLGFNLSDISVFTINFSFTPRKNLYFFVLATIFVIFIAAGIVALLFCFFYICRIRPYIDRKFLE